MSDDCKEAFDVASAYDCVQIYFSVNGAGEACTDMTSNVRLDVLFLRPVSGWLTRKT